MRLILSVYNARKQFLGHVGIGLRWLDKRWFLTSDPRSVWLPAYPKEGRFELKGSRVLEILDHDHKIVLLEDAPTSVFDRRHTFSSANGSIYSPIHRASSVAKINWVVENELLSPIRQKAVNLLDTLFPAPYHSLNWKKNRYKSEKPARTTNYTNCVEFPAGYVELLMGKDKGMALGLGYPPPTTPGWTNADGVKLPLPGDIFVLCEGLKRDGSTTHVGVIYSTNWKNSDGLKWRTADWGQHSGWDGDWVERVFDPVGGTLTGGRRTRAIKGWVDLDVFFGNVKSNP